MLRMNLFHDYYGAALLLHVMMAIGTKYFCMKGVTLLPNPRHTCLSGNDLSIQDGDAMKEDGSISLALCEKAVQHDNGACIHGHGIVTTRCMMTNTILHPSLPDVNFEDVGNYAPLLAHLNPSRPPESCNGVMRLLHVMSCRCLRDASGVASSNTPKVSVCSDATSM